MSVGKKGGFGRRDSRARRWREDPPAAPRILRGPGGRGSARARGGCGRVSTSSRVLRLRLRLARVFSPAVSVRVACVWRAGGGEARRVSSRRGGVGFDAAGRAVVRSRCARGAGERTIEATRTRNRAALFVVAEAGLLVVTRAVLVYFIIEPSEKQSVAYGTVELQHTSSARSGRVFVPIVRLRVSARSLKRPP